MKFINKISSLFLAGTLSLMAQNGHYAMGEMHTLTLPKGEGEVYFIYSKLNDQLDLLNLKKKELASIGTTASIGDYKGYTLGVLYAFTDKLMFSYSHEKQTLEYTSAQLHNTKDNLYIRYNYLQNSSAIFNSGITFDLGIEQNKLDNFYFKELNTINQLISKVPSLPDVKIEQVNGDYIVSHKDGTSPNVLTDAPYIALENTQDQSVYFRALTGMHSPNYMLDFYLGYKKTKIKSVLTTSQEILDKNSDLRQILDRTEQVVSAGVNYAVQINSFIYEINYEYEIFLRDAGLDYMPDNHIVNANISYKVNKHFLLSIGGKFMYRQLNGQIPYLYNQYTQTAYDHKYGYADFGVKYKF